MTGEGLESMTTNTKTDLSEKQHKQDAKVIRVLQAVLVLWCDTFGLGLLYEYVFEVLCFHCPVVFQESLMERYNLRVEGCVSVEGGYSCFLQKVCTCSLVTRGPISSHGYY